jgi:ATP-dependent helicase HrpB
MRLVKNKSPLPVDAILPDIIRSLKCCTNLVIEAPPGAGKTTRVPAALLDLVSGDVVVLEPRRISARLAARRVAWELGEELGETVGYQVRFEQATSARTRLRFVTDGILARRFHSDPSLRGVDAVVLDEFHERHLESDLVLALLKRLQRTRPELLIVVMSATLDSGPVAEYLGGCPILRSEGRQFELSISHRPYSPDSLDLQVRRAVELLLAEEQQGHILIFLPGTSEIRRAMRECGALAKRAALLMLPLHGNLSPAEQDRAVSPTAQQKLIFATNVAESSVTVEGVAAVIDSGLARRATYSQWTGLPTLQVARVSKASAAQRAGRAGRTGPGRVIRLYPLEDYLQRVEYDVPEILRSDLSQLCLDLRAMNIEDLSTIEWLDLPPAQAIQTAEQLLDRLGVTEEMAKQLCRYPLPPRLSRIVVDAMERGVGEDGCVVAAMLESGVRIEKIDLLEAMDAEQDVRTQKHVEQIRRIARPTPQAHRDDDALLMSLLTAFPDRVARLRSGNQVLLSTGVSAEIAGERPPYEFMVALDAEDRREKPLPLIRLAARIEPEWLIGLFPERVREETSVTWNRMTERVEAVNSLLYDDLTIQESRGIAATDVATELLVSKAIEAGIEKFMDRNLLDALIIRVEFAGLEFPDVARELRHLCIGLQSFAELKTVAGDLPSALERKIGVQRLNELAPAQIRLKNGRQTKVHYEPGKPPWIASRLQDFFGMHETPRLGLQRTPVVVQLLAPNHRPVQTTTDLAGFWERLYPQVRRELMRRYPKHAWPERP